MTTTTINEACTARQVIERSIVMHPSCLREALENMATTHALSAANTFNPDVRRIAQDMASQCQIAAANVDRRDVDALMGNMTRWTSALIAASRLQCIPASIRNDIAARGEG